MFSKLHNGALPEMFPSVPTWLGAGPAFSVVVLAVLFWLPLGVEDAHSGFCGLWSRL